MGCCSSPTAGDSKMSFHRPLRRSRSSCGNDDWRRSWRKHDAALQPVPIFGAAMTTVSASAPGAGSQVAVLAELGIAALATDRDGVVRECNHAAAALYGRPEREMVGVPVSTVGLFQADSAIARFTYLEQLPVDVLKIDIGFVRDLTSGSASRHVLEALVNLAAALGLETVSEGVEDQQHPLCCDRSGFITPKAFTSDVEQPCKPHTNPTTLRDHGNELPERRLVCSKAGRTRPGADVHVHL
jgi:EAL domain